MKIKQVCEKPKFWVRELITRREGVSTLQCPPEGVMKDYLVPFLRLLNMV